jgi:hypothetical protein
MKLFVNSIKHKLPWPVVLVVIGSTLAGATYFEKKSLDKLDHEQPDKLNCIKCHTDRKTMINVASKANDLDYLVHHGDITHPQLMKLMSPKNKAKRLDPATIESMRVLPQFK